MNLRVLKIKKFSQGQCSIFCKNLKNWRNFAQNFQALRHYIEERGEIFSICIEPENNVKMNSICNCRSAIGKGSFLNENTLTTPENSTFRKVSKNGQKINFSIEISSKIFKTRQNISDFRQVEHRFPAGLLKISKNAHLFL